MSDSPSNESEWVDLSDFLELRDLDAQEQSTPAPTEASTGASSTKQDDEWLNVADFLELEDLPSAAGSDEISATYD